jgi:hypothetical protein
MPNMVRPDHADILALAAGGDPANLVSDHDPEVGLIGTKHRASRGKGRSDPVAVGRVNMLGQLFKADGVAPGQAPELEPALVHREAVIIDVPGPQATPAASTANLKCSGFQLCGAGRPG